MSSSSCCTRDVHSRPINGGTVSGSWCSADLRPSSSSDCRSLNGPDSMLSSREGATSLEELGLKRPSRFRLRVTWRRMHKLTSLELSFSFNKYFFGVLELKHTKKLISYQRWQRRRNVFPTIHYTAHIVPALSYIPVRVELSQIPIIHILRRTTWPLQLDVKRTIVVTV